MKIKLIAGVLLLLYSCKNSSVTTAVNNQKDVTLTEALKSEMAHNIKSETQELNTGLILSNIESNKAVLFKDLIRENVLFFYYSNIHCNECVDNECELIKKNYKKGSSDHNRQRKQCQKLNDL